MPFRPRVVIRFSESIPVPHGEGAEVYLREEFPAPWGGIMARFPWIHLRPVFVAFRTREDLPAMVGPVRAMPPGIGMHVLPPPSSRVAHMFETDAPDVGSAQALVAALRLPDLLALVRRAQIRGRRTRPPKVAYADDKASRYQGYQKAAPRGIGARPVWDRQGSNGAGVRIVDVEFGWELGHQQLPGTINLVSGVNDVGSRAHGVAVLGILVARDDQAGIVGLCPGASMSVASAQRSDDVDDVDYAAAIEDAVGTLGVGDILLLELQARYPPPDGAEGYPIEIEEDVFVAIQEATDRGVIVVEAAGNAGVDLDVFGPDDEARSMNRASPKFEDSGAIMVGACENSKTKRKHQWRNPSNYGSRINCYAWGDGIATLWPVNALQMQFNGTSGAAAIVAGAAAIVQGIVRQRYQEDSTRIPFLSPGEMRTLLASNGTPTVDAATYPIGLMPDLEAIVGTFAG